MKVKNINSVAVTLFDVSGDSITLMPGESRIPDSFGQDLPKGVVDMDKSLKKEVKAKEKAKVKSVPNVQPVTQPEENVVQKSQKENKKN